MPRCPFYFGGPNHSGARSIDFAVVEEGRPADYEELKHAAAAALCEAKTTGAESVCVEYGESADLMKEGQTQPWEGGKSGRVGTVEKPCDNGH